MRRIINQVVDAIFLCAVFTIAVIAGFSTTNLFVKDNHVNNVSSALNVEQESFLNSSHADLTDNDYRDDVEEFANMYNMKIVYSFDKVPEGCLGHSTSNTVALVCSAYPEYIFVNTDGVHKNVYRKRFFVDYIKHEIAHKLIYDKCGELVPTIAGDNIEAATSSYAVLYLDADKEALENSVSMFSKYKMTEESDKIATSIYHGKCL